MLPCDKMGDVGIRGGYTGAPAPAEVAWAVPGPDA